jgi:hypothetical protein
LKLANPTILIVVIFAGPYDSGKLETELTNSGVEEAVVTKSDQTVTMVECSIMSTSLRTEIVVVPLAARILVVPATR